MTKTRRSGGFTLVELAIVLTIAAVLIATAASVGASRIEAQRLQTTNERLLFILNAIDQYVRTYNHLPCPADGTLAVAAAAFGYGAGTDTDGGSCTAGNLLTGGSGNIVAGTVPLKELGLAAIVGNDGWDRRFTYAVDRDLTFVDRDDPAVAGYTYSSSAGNITVQNAAGTAITSTGAALVISHGANGYGAWPGKGGSRISPTGGGTEEDENADSDEVFVQIFSNNTYDDMIEFRNKWQIAQ